MLSIQTTVQASLNTLANIIIANYFINHYCLIVITDNASNFEYNGSIPLLQITFDNDTFGSTEFLQHVFGCQGIILSSDSPAELVANFEYAIKNSVGRFNRRRYLVFSSNFDTENEIENVNGLKSVYDLKDLDFICDLLVLIPVFNNERNDTPMPNFVIQLTTHRFDGETGNNDMIVIDKWFSTNQTFLYKRNLYPDKIHNQMGRPLKMATFTYEPYSIVGETLAESHGSELSTAVQYAKKFNATPVFVVNEYDYWGELYDNWTGSGLLGNLIMDNADIGFGALYTWEFCYPYLDLSKPLVRTGITCLVPAPKPAARWLTPIDSYSPMMWLITGILFVFSIICLSSTVYFYENNYIMCIIYDEDNLSYYSCLNYSTLCIIKQFLSQSLTNEEFRKELATKAIIAIMLVTSVFVSSTYSSGLASVMTIERYEEPIDTVKELVEKGIYWGATQDAWIKSIEKSDDPLYQAVVAHFITGSEEKLRNLSLQGGYGFAIERLPFENYAIGSYIERDVIQMYYLMREDLYWEQCVIMTRKSSVFLPTLDDFILRAFEAGLISVWQNEAVALSMDEQVQRATKLLGHHDTSQRLVKLQLIHVQGAFAVMILGYCFAFIIFICELLYHHSVYYFYPYRVIFIP